MKNKNFFNNYIHYSIYLIASFLFAYFLDISMSDDGLRHIAFSANQDIMKNWGEVFPYSLFSTYDPWFMWHLVLKFISNTFEYNFIHVIINTVSLFLLSIGLDSLLKREVKYNFVFLSYIVIWSIVFLSANRYLMIRPDLLSGLFVIFSIVLRDRTFLIFLLTILYGPFYYLFFIYTGSMGLVFLIQKRIKSLLAVFFGSILVLIIHLVYDKDGYLVTVKNILLDQKLRMGLEVNEGKPLIGLFENIDYFILLPVFAIVSFLLIYKYYDYFRTNILALFLLVTSILWINQARYFVLFLPIIIVYLLSIFNDLNMKNFFRKIRLIIVYTKKNILYAKKSFLFFIVAIPYCIFMFSYSYSNKSQNESIENANFFKNEVFNNKTILLNNLHGDLYKALYHNPRIKFVPSCSVGWFSDENSDIKKIYIQMMKKEGISEKELKKLIDYVKADFYIHYLRNEKQILDFEKLEKLGIIPEMIYKNRIIFRIKKGNKTSE